MRLQFGEVGYVGGAHVDRRQIRTDYLKQQLRDEWGTVAFTAVPSLPPERKADRPYTNKQYRGLQNPANSGRSYAFVRASGQTLSVFRPVGDHFERIDQGAMPFAFKDDGDTLVLTNREQLKTEIDLCKAEPVEIWKRAATGIDCDVNSGGSPFRPGQILKVAKIWTAPIR